MKTYLPYFYKKIGIAFVLIAVVLSFAANINDLLAGFIDGWNLTDGIISKSEFNIISSEMGRILTWISLFFSFSGFLLYMFSSEKVEDEFIEQLRFKCLAKSLVFTWIIASALIIINGKLQLEGLYILQLQLFVYVVLFAYNKHWKYI